MSTRGSRRSDGRLNPYTLDGKSVAELRALLSDRAQPTDGCKATLVLRLQDALLNDTLGESPSKQGGKSKVPESEPRGSKRGADTSPSPAPKKGRKPPKGVPAWAQDAKSETTPEKPTRGRRSQPEESPKVKEPPSLPAEVEEPVAEKTPKRRGRKSKAEKELESAKEAESAEPEAEKTEEEPAPKRRGRRSQADSKDGEKPKATPVKEPLQIVLKLKGRRSKSLKTDRDKEPEPSESAEEPQMTTRRGRRSQVSTSKEHDVSDDSPPKLDLPPAKSPEEPAAPSPKKPGRASKSQSRESQETPAPVEPEPPKTTRATRRSGGTEKPRTESPFDMSAASVIGSMMFGESEPPEKGKPFSPSKPVSVKDVEAEEPIVLKKTRKTPSKVEKAAEKEPKAAELKAKPSKSKSSEVAEEPATVVPSADAPPDLIPESVPASLAFETAATSLPVETASAPVPVAESHETDATQGDVETAECKDSKRKPRKTPSKVEKAAEKETKAAKLKAKPSKSRSSEVTEMVEIVPSSDPSPDPVPESVTASLPVFAPTSSPVGMAPTILAVETAPEQLSVAEESELTLEEVEAAARKGQTRRRTPSPIPEVRPKSKRLSGRVDNLEESKRQSAKAELARLARKEAEKHAKKSAEPKPTETKQPAETEPKQPPELVSESKKSTEPRPEEPKKPSEPKPEKKQTHMERRSEEPRPSDPKKKSDLSVPKKSTEAARRPPDISVEVQSRERPKITSIVPTEQAKASEMERRKQRREREQRGSTESQSFAKDAKPKSARPTDRYKGLDEGLTREKSKEAVDAKSTVKPTVTVVPRNLHRKPSLLSPVKKPAPKKTSFTADLPDFLKNIQVPAPSSKIKKGPGTPGSVPAWHSQSQLRPPTTTASDSYSRQRSRKSRLGQGGLNPFPIPPVGLVTLVVAGQEHPPPPPPMMPIPPVPPSGLPPMSPMVWDEAAVRSQMEAAVAFAKAR